MAYQQKQRHRVSSISIGLTAAALLLLRCSRHSRLLMRSIVVALVSSGERRGRQRMLDEVRMIAHGQLQAHIFALQHALRLAENATASDVAQHLHDAQVQTRMLLRQVKGLYAEPSNNVSSSDFEQSLHDASASLSGAYPQCAYSVTVFGRATTTLLPALQHSLLVVLYNALQNAHIHGHATSIRVQLHYAPDAVVLIISDDGIGLPAGSSTKKGRGLRDMQRVVEQQGGELLVESKPRGGTCVVATLPMQLEP